MKDTDKISLAALICGITSIFVFPLLLGGLGVALGIMGMNRNEKGTNSYDLARIGLICGIVGLVLWVVTMVLLGALGVNPNSLMGGITPNTPESSAF